MTYAQRRQWFTDRIGKRIWREDTGCPCGSCLLIKLAGILVEDERHAAHLCDTKHDGKWINYFDSKNEVK